MTELQNYVNYRVASPFDVGDIMRLEAENHPAPRSERWWLNRLSRGEETQTVVHVASHGGYGDLLGYVVSTWATPTSIRIDKLMVAPKTRRIRIASRLLLRVLSDKPPEATRLVYTVPEQAVDVQLFLKSVGFQAKLPLRENAFKFTDTGIGIRFEWDEVQDEVR